MNPCLKPERAKPRVWASFWSVPTFEDFDLGGKTIFTKVNLLQAEFRSCAGAGGNIKRRWIAPWTKVRTSKRVAKCSGEESARLLFGIPLEARPNKEVSRNGLVLDKEAFLAPEKGTSYQPTSYAHPATEQPHNDNQIHGPTS